MARQTFHVELWRYTISARERTSRDMNSYEEVSRRLSVQVQGYALIALLSLSEFAVLNKPNGSSFGYRKPNLMKCDQQIYPSTRIIIDCHARSLTNRWFRLSSDLQKLCANFVMLTGTNSWTRLGCCPRSKFAISWKTYSENVQLVSAPVFVGMRFEIGISKPFELLFESHFPNSLFSAHCNQRRSSEYIRNHCSSHVSMTKNEN